MSHIDSYDHVLVGYFGPLPVYRPLEDIAFPPEGERSEDFGCRTDQIVIGGGSGEHPGLVLERPGAAMAAFALESDSFAFPTVERIALDAHVGAAPVHQRYGWTKDRERSFARLCRSDAMVNAHWPGAGDLDRWLTLGFGEFCYAAMPELDPDMAARLRGFQREPLKHVYYSNILLPPPGLPVYARSGTAFEARLRHPVEKADKSGEA
ncbi:MAG: hypothetical protein ABL308_04630 [Oceanicaulis sp.]